MNSSKSALLLDDSEDLLVLEKLYIERLCGYNAITAKSFQDVQALGQQVFACDLAILDINLGLNEPNGVDVYRWLRSRGFTSPIFFLTGHARNNPLVTEAEALGDAKVLSKPLSAEELVRIVRGIK